MATTKSKGADEAKAEEPKAECEVLSRIKHDGVEYEIGATVLLTEAQARELVPHTVKPAAH